LGAKRKEIYIYADSMHEIYNDLDRALCLKDLFQFLDSLKILAGEA
jgi:alpha-beta hydrolase superfamily lysophospholipase